MARQNIDDQWWSDPRRGHLIAKTGNLYMADGIMLNAWKLAETFWLPDKKLIPISAWENSGLPNLLFECRLAEMREDFVYVRGIEQRMEWWFKARDLGRIGGKKSAQRPRDALGRLLPRVTQVALENIQATSKGFQPSSSYTGLPSVSPPLPTPLSGVIESVCIPLSPKPELCDVRASVVLVVKEWEHTLDKSGITPRVSQGGIQSIERLIHDEGVDATIAAMRGMLREPKSENFDPKMHVSLRRLATHFEKFMNLGMQKIDLNISEGKEHARRTQEEYDLKIAKLGNQA